MSSFRRFVQILVPLLFVLYGILLFIDSERYFPSLPPLAGSLIGAFMMAVGAWLYTREKYDY